jgi:hypothetical protein
MVVRLILGIAWALVVGLAGGWLMLSPWALGQQPSGKDWTSVTQTDFFTGLGLAVLGALGLVLVVAQTVSVLRESGILGRRQAPAAAGGRRSASDGATAPDSPELESTLVGLAQALTRELQAGAASPPSGADAAAPGDKGQGQSEFPPAFRRLEG